MATAYRKSAGSSIAVDFPYWKRASKSNPWELKRYTLLNTWEMFSQNHPKSRHGHYGEGGPFYLEKVTTYAAQTPLAKPNGQPYPVGVYSGYIIAGSVTGFVPTGLQNTPSDASIASDGATAISRVHPERPDFSLAQQLGELRERFPSVVGSSLLRDKVNIARKSGNEYLNVEFGWKPLISSVLDFARTVKESNSIVSGYVRKNQEHTRRRYNFPQLLSMRTDSSTGGNFYPVDAALAATTAYYEKVTHDKWFEGAFIYWVPVPDTLQGQILLYESRANKLLGTRLTPSVLWELAPWSWAVDWFSNTGEIFQNLSYIGADASVMKYGYMMNHLKTELQVSQYRDTSGYNVKASKTVVSDIKMRRPSSPYGFSVEWDGMTSRQIAIATALGLTRS